MIRFGLCCLFVKEPVRFRTLTAKHLLTLPPRKRTGYISEVCLHNVRALDQAVATVSRLGIGAFRVLSPLFPRITHPRVGYQLEDLPDVADILECLSRVRKFGRKERIRLSFHPDQFILLSSPNENVTESSIRELEYQGMVAEKIGAEVINIHGGGQYGDKHAALKRLRKNFRRLSPRVRKRLSLENDDRTYTVQDLLPVCQDIHVPLVYDVHHHRCNPDGLTVAEATERSIATWYRRKQEPYFHISSPKSGWSGPDTRSHSDYVNPVDFPDEWKALDCTVDVEAKAKEEAVLRLRRDLGMSPQV